MEPDTHPDAASFAWAHLPGASVLGVRVFALVNHAVATGLMDALQRWKPLRWRSLLEGTPESGAIDVAPILMELGPLDQMPSASSIALLSWLHRRIPTSNGLILLQSTWQFDELATALHARLDARLEPDVPVMLRYFDTRILVTLSEALEPAQFEAFCAVARRWAWLDRFGQWREQAASESSIDPYPRPLRLTQAQEDRLVELATPDSIVRLLKELAPDLGAGRPEGDLHALAQRCASTAQTFGVTNLREVTLFCMVELQEGPNFHEQPRWHESMKDRIQAEGDFVTLVSELSES